MAISVTMPMIMVMPIIAAIFNYVPLIQRPRKTPAVASNGISNTGMPNDIGVF